MKTLIVDKDDCLPLREVSCKFVTPGSRASVVLATLGTLLSNKLLIISCSLLSQSGGKISPGTVYVSRAIMNGKIDRMLFDPKVLRYKIRI